MIIAQLQYSLDDRIMTQRTLHLRIGAEDIMLAMHQEASKRQATALVPGFRRGRAPLKRVLAHLWPELAERAFEELKSAALEQVLAKLAPQDKPLIPPEVLERDKLNLREGEGLEFAVKYLVDPTAASASPEQPEQGAVLPGSAIQQGSHSMGIPLGPQLPRTPGLPTGPQE